MRRMNLVMTGTLLAASVMWGSQFLQVFAGPAPGIWIGREMSAATGSDGGRQEDTATGSEARLLRQIRQNRPWDGYSVSESWEGEGEEENPYLIQCPEDLKLLAECVSRGETMEETYFLLADDLDLNGKAWISIGYDTEKNDGETCFGFAGYFDGGGHWVKGLYQRYSNTRSCVGLFAALEGATVTDVKIEGVVAGYDRAGGLAGSAEGSEIIRCVSSVNVISSNRGGGLVGVLEGESLISDCENTRYVRCGSSVRDSAAGGIAGVLDGGIVSDCVSYGDVTARDSAGGIVGKLCAGAVYNCEIPGGSKSPVIGGQNEHNQNLYPEFTGGIAGTVTEGDVKNCRFGGTIRYSTDESKYAGLYIGAAENGNLGDNFSHLYCARGKEAMDPFGVGPNDVIKREHSFGTYEDNEVRLWTSSEGLGEPEPFMLFQILEQGVLAIAEEAVHHFAPDRKGNPVRGYYLHVPQIENGTLSARQVNDFSYVIDSAHPGAVTAGSAVKVFTEPINIEENESEGIEAVVFTLIPGSLRYITLGEQAEEQKIHGSSFVMPKEGAYLTAEYQARVSGVTLDRRELVFTIEEKRTGLADSPVVQWTVTEDQKLTADVRPRRADDKGTAWSIDQKELASVDESGLVKVNREAAWIKALQEESEKEFVRPSSPSAAAKNPIILEDGRQGMITVTTNDGGFKDSCKVTVRYRLMDATYRRSGGSVGSGGSGSFDGSSAGSGAGGPGALRQAAAEPEEGSWLLDKNGWWYRYADGTYPVSCWKRLIYNGVSSWYYFDAAGYMEEGWLTLGENTYYLHPLSDGTRGHMYTGRHLIDGQWYEFDTSPGAGEGRLLGERRS